jgi:hypothetical protein
MKKVTTMFLMLCLLFSGALSYAHSEASIENEKKGDGVPIELKECTGVSSLDKSNAITPVIDGHVLTVAFTENLGQVAVEVTTASGALVDGTTTITPNGVQIYIPLAGDYIVTFTLPNGDVYYGEFTVTD